MTILSQLGRIFDASVSVVFIALSLGLAGSIQPVQACHGGVDGAGLIHADPPRHRSISDAGMLGQVTTLVQQPGSLRRIDGWPQPRRHAATCCGIRRQKCFAHGAQRIAAGKGRLEPPLRHQCAPGQQQRAGQVVHPVQRHESRDPGEPPVREMPLVLVSGKSAMCGGKPGRRVEAHDARGRQHQPDPQLGAFGGGTQQLPALGQFVRDVAKHLIAALDQPHGPVPCAAPGLPVEWLELRHGAPVLSSC